MTHDDKGQPKEEDPQEGSKVFQVDYAAWEYQRTSWRMWFKRQVGTVDDFRVHLDLPDWCRRDYYYYVRRLFPQFWLQFGGFLVAQWPKRPEVSYSNWCASLDRNISHRHPIVERWCSKETIELVSRQIAGTHYKASLGKASQAMNLLHTAWNHRVIYYDEHYERSRQALMGLANEQLRPLSRFDDYRGYMRYFVDLAFYNPEVRYDPTDLWESIAKKKKSVDYREPGDRDGEPTPPEWIGLGFNRIMKEDEHAPRQVNSILKVHRGLRWWRPLWGT